MGKTIVDRNGNLVYRMTQEEIEEEKLVKFLKPGESTPSGRYVMREGYVIDNSMEDWDEADPKAQAEYVVSEAVRYIPSKDMREYLLRNPPSWDWRQCFTVAFSYAPAKHEKMRYFRFMLRDGFVRDGRCRHAIKKALKIMKRCPSEMVEGSFGRSHLKDPEFSPAEKRKSMNCEEDGKTGARCPWFWASWLDLPEIFKKGDVVRSVRTGRMHVVSSESDSGLAGQDWSDDLITANILKSDYVVSDDARLKFAKSYDLEPGECDLKMMMRRGYYHVHLDPCVLEKVADAGIPEKYRSSLARIREALS